MTESHQAPVVAPVKMPKLKVDHKSLAGVNAWSIALACFFGFAGVFAAIAAFTVKAKTPWSFSMPVLTGLLGANGRHCFNTITWYALRARHGRHWYRHDWQSH